MEVIEIKVFSFEELESESKEKARKLLTNSEYWADYIIHDAVETFHKFAEIFEIVDWSLDFFHGTSRNWIKINLDSDIKALSGIRLLKYIHNNYYDYLYKRKWYNVKSEKVLKHKNIKAVYDKRYKKGFIQGYYSAIQKDSDCVLTGMCYDNDLLEPMYNFLKKPDESITFEELITDCVSRLCEVTEEEYDYTHTDDYIIEHCSANEIKFLESGRIFNC